MSARIGTPEQEAAHQAKMAEHFKFAMFDLRETLQPSFKPDTFGYKTVEEAREGIIRRAWKDADKIAADYLRSLK